MCHLGTARSMRSTVIPMLLLSFAAAGQVRVPAWRQVGSRAVELNLASPATGSVRQVWFSDDGSTLYAVTSSGKTFSTSDFEQWQPVTNPPEAPAQVPGPQPE